MNKSIYAYILVMAAVSYLIRVFPLAIIRKPITNKYVKSFLYYIPYVTLTVMTFPAIIYATDSKIAGVLSLAVGILLAVFTQNLFVVAFGCCITVLLLSFI